MGSSAGPVVVVLDVVEPIRVGLPHIDPRAGDRASPGVPNGPLDPAGLPARGARDVAAPPDVRRIVDEERSEDRGLGRLAVCLVVDVDGLHRRTQRVGEQDELLTPVSRWLDQPR